MPPRPPPHRSPPTLAATALAPRWIAGVDGCPGGWVRVARRCDTGAMHAAVLPDLAALAEPPDGAGAIAAIGLDMPIGLLERGRRACDAEARRVLGWPRCSSVFDAPIRPALAAGSRAEAAAITEAIDGRRVSAQAWNLFPRIRAVDAWLRDDAALRAVVHEVHPEVSFAAWSGGPGLRASKRSPEGRAQRLALVASWLGAEAVPAARAACPRRAAADDDVLDAFAALWTAERLDAGIARTLPAAPPRDAHGLTMAIRC